MTSPPVFGGCGPAACLPRVCAQTLHGMGGQARGRAGAVSVSVGLGASEGGDASAGDSGLSGGAFKSTSGSRI